MSRYIYSPSARNMSIYSHRKEFDTPVDELNFAKDYNLKINPISNASRKSFDSNDKKTRNPITDSQEDAFRSSCRKTQFSDKSQINFDKFNKVQEANADHWRSSSKKVEQKPSQSFFELRKRELMNVNEVKKIIRNPIVNENCNNMVPLRIRQERPISIEYSNFKNKQTFLPSEIHDQNYHPIKAKQMGNEFKQLFQFHDGTNENVTKKVNEFPIAERRFVDGNRNLKHHKKIDHLIEAQEKMKQILRK